MRLSPRYLQQLNERYFFYGICAGPLRCMFWGAAQTGLAEPYHRRLCDDQSLDDGAVSGVAQSAQAGAWHIVCGIG